MTKTRLIHSCISTELRLVTYRDTGGWIQGHGIYHASIALRGKNHGSCKKHFNTTMPKLILINTETSVSFSAVMLLTALRKWHLLTKMCCLFTEVLFWNTETNWKPANPSSPEKWPLIYIYIYI